MYGRLSSHPVQKINEEERVHVADVRVNSWQEICREDFGDQWEMEGRAGEAKRGKLLPRNRLREVDDESEAEVALQQPAVDPQPCLVQDALSLTLRASFPCILVCRRVYLCP